MFQFQGFTPSASIRAKANRLLGRLQEEAPSGAKTSASLVWDGDEYTCTISLQSRLYPITVNTSHWNAGIALDKAEFALARKLEKRGVQFITGTSSPAALAREDIR
ncbi:MAG: hypothetical protein ACXWP1_04280 [Bdellovibrionota bacterium]